MEKHMLLTISADRSALYGVKFVCDFFDRKEDMRFTLFYTMPPGPSEVVMGQDKDLYLQQKKRFELEAEEAARAMDNARDILCRRGFDCGIQAMRLQNSRFSKAVDIVREAEEGLYDSVIVGRRGVSWFEAALNESVSAQVLNETFQIPTWFCRQPETDRRNVLLCVDGSEQSLRIADHVGFMLTRESRHEIDLLHIQTPKDEGEDCDKIFDAAQEALTENGVPKERINRRLLYSSAIAKAILREAQDRRYAVVAMGRTGSGRGLLGHLFLGSCSRDLFNEFTGGSLWLSY